MNSDYVERAAQVSAALRELRAALEVSQEQFAHRIGTTVRTISRYERGRLPNLKQLVQLEKQARLWSQAGPAATFRAAYLAELGLEEGELAQAAGSRNIEP